MLRKVGLFALSLWLLFVLIIIITINVPVCFSGCEFIGWYPLLFGNVIPIICLVCLIIGGISYWDFSYQTKGSPELSFQIIKIENIDYEHLTFLTTYIIPLVCFQFDSVRYQLVFVIILLVIGIIYVRTDLFYANPTLAILQFRIYKVDGQFRNGSIRESKIIICKQKLLKDDHVKYLKLDERIYYAYKTSNK
ncbi:anti-phage protein KwaA [Marinoscillum pacificum]|uniref:anti-phage protein KwaA n=1 Tax=Marinoscillum pacificum TaxID=392723 RepID=UPI00215800FC|nr:anti-phage protein KwaA [Marinoscillum pacificum]